jgi:hypothetical protein
MRKQETKVTRQKAKKVRRWEDKKVGMIKVH